jgi:cell wall-associated NlpC family hydrolase
VISAEERVAVINIVNPLIGMRWRPNTYGEQGFFDCWGLVVYVQKHLFGRDLPTINSPAMDEASLATLFSNTDARWQWRPRPQGQPPKHGDLVEMARGPLPHHAGVWLEIDRGKVLHCAAGHGVTFQSLLDLKASHWRVIQYNEWLG